jgi:hypothetical protein
MQLVVASRWLPKRFQLRSDKANHRSCPTTNQQTQWHSVGEGGDKHNTQSALLGAFAAALHLAQCVCVWGLARFGHADGCFVVHRPCWGLPTMLLVSASTPRCRLPEPADQQGGEREGDKTPMTVPAELSLFWTERKRRLSIPPLWFFFCTHRSSIVENHPLLFWGYSCALCLFCTAESSVVCRSTMLHMDCKRRDWTVSQRGTPNRIGALEHDICCLILVLVLVLLILVLVLFFFMFRVSSPASPPWMGSDTHPFNLSPINGAGGSCTELIRSACHADRTTAKPRSRRAHRLWFSGGGRAALCLRYPSVVDLSPRSPNQSAQPNAHIPMPTFQCPHSNAHIPMPAPPLSSKTWSVGRSIQVVLLVATSHVSRRATQIQPHSQMCHTALDWTGLSRTVDSRFRPGRSDPPKKKKETPCCAKVSAQRSRCLGGCVTLVDSAALHPQTNQRTNYHHHHLLLLPCPPKAPSQPPVKSLLRVQRRALLGQKEQRRPSVHPAAVHTELSPFAQKYSFFSLSVCLCFQCQPWVARLVRATEHE